MKIIAVWILNMVDFDIALTGDILHIVVKLGNKVVMDRSFDLVPDAVGTKRSVT